MSRRWNWDFEDEQRASRRPVPPAAPPPPASAPPAHPPLHGARERFRRRRALGFLVLALVLAATAAALSGSRSAHKQSAAAGSGGGQPGVAAVRPQESAADEAKAVRAVLAYTPFVKEGGTRGRDVALTFDDGPGPYTPALLSVLEREHVRATFFAIGKMVRYFGASTVRELQDGDVVGDHTQTHPLLARLSAHDQREELSEGIARVELQGAARPLLFRPPYGSFNATTMRELRALHLLMVMWSVDTRDFAQPGVPAIVERALAGAHPGAILLLHDGGGNRSQTIAALPAIIRGLRARGFHLVTVPQLLIDDPPPAGQRLPPNLSGD